MKTLSRCAGHGCLCALLLASSLAHGTDRMINISTNGIVGDAGMAAGFLVTGTTPRRFIILGERISSSINPLLRLTDLSGERVFASNDNWREHPTAAEVERTLRAPASDEDAAFAITLSPGTCIARLSNEGSVVVGPRRADGGTAIVAINDVSGGGGIGRLIDISTNGIVDADMAAGFIIAGRDERRIVVLGERFNSAIDPLLRLTDVSGNEVFAQNDNWSDHPTAAEVEAALRAPGIRTDAAFAITLPPGRYVARLSSANGQSGAGIVAINDVTPDREFVVVWEDDRSGNGRADILGRGFDADGGQRFADLTVTGVASGRQRKPAVAMTREGGFMTRDGGFVTVWGDDRDGNGAFQILARGFNADGGPRFAELTVNSVAAGQQLLPAVAMP